MAQFCVNENTCIDIIEVNGAYYSTVWLQDLVFNFGPVYDITSLIHDIRLALRDLNTAMRIASSNSLESLKYHELLPH